MRCVIIQPPLVQLNAPYPSGAYLSNFFKQCGHDATWLDLSNKLFARIFSAEGLQQIFDLSQKKALSLIARARKNGDDWTAFNIERYLLTKESWITWIERIKSILCHNANSGREWCHALVFSPFAPRGRRMEQFLANLATEPTVDDARFLASLALADLADYITYTFDENFSLVRYAESVSSAHLCIDEILRAFDAPIIKHFYAPLVKAQLDDVLGKIVASSATMTDAGAPTANASATMTDAGATITNTSATNDATPTTNTPHANNAPMTSAQTLTEPVLFCISVPFAGTYIPALYTARYIKQNYRNAIVALGGGFVNTELRDTADAYFADFFDCMSFDRGYGSYYELFKACNIKSATLQEIECKNGNTAACATQNVKKVTKCKIIDEKTPLYKMRLFNAICIDDDGTGSIKISTKALQAKAQCACQDNQLKDEQIAHQEAIDFENAMTYRVVPDYSDVDFGDYPRVCDDKNAMHRLWNDGAWIKAYLAHGCYWHKCAFCDVHLDYVCNFKRTNVQNVFNALAHTARTKGVSGVHLVDEALAPVLVKQFAELNINDGSPLFFWGNVRFEKTFTKDLASFLAYGGLSAVSAGIEIATGRGLDLINKGTDIDTIVCACAAFKEAGILVHAYMIYGFWFETPQDLINSLETLRQFFACGLLDSAFWHKFTLTKNSKVYGEFLAGMHPELKAFEDKNGIHFAGEEKSTRYGEGLNNALNEWMNGRGLEKNVKKWFNFAMPEPTIAKNYIANAISRYEKNNKTLYAKPILQKDIARLFWLGSNIFAKDDCLEWFYLQEKETLGVPKHLHGKELDIVNFLHALKPSAQRQNNLTCNDDILTFITQLRGRGLVLI